jgi:MFS family permease
MGNWAASIPIIKDKHAISNGTLGNVLFAAAGGALVAIPLVTYISTVYGSYVSCILGAIIMVAVFPIIGVTDDFFMLIIGAFVLGVGLLVLDSSMNTQAVLLELSIKKPILGHFHAVYAIGGLTGALLGGALFEAGLSLFWEFFIFSITIIIPDIVFGFFLYTFDDENEINFFNAERNRSFSRTLSNSMFPKLVHSSANTPNRTRGASQANGSNPFLHGGRGMSQSSQPMTPVTPIGLSLQENSPLERGFVANSKISFSENNNNGNNNNYNPPNNNNNNNNNNNSTYNIIHSGDLYQATLLNNNSNNTNNDPETSSSVTNSCKVNDTKIPFLKRLSGTRSADEQKQQQQAHHHHTLEKPLLPPIEHGLPVIHKDYYSLFIISLLGFIGYFGEGSIGDWSALYLTTQWDCSPLVATFGYVGFQLSVAIGRFYSDKIVLRMGRKLLLIVSGIIAGVGLLLAVIASFLPSNDMSLAMAIIGFAICGAGLSALSPTVISLAGSGIVGFLPATALAIVTAVGYTGILIGPPILGNFAQAVGSLSWSFLLDSGLITGISLVVLVLPKKYQQMRGKSMSYAVT